MFTVKLSRDKKSADVMLQKGYTAMLTKKESAIYFVYAYDIDEVIDTLQEKKIPFNVTSLKDDE